jgi:hypothetical protein
MRFKVGDTVFLSDKIYTDGRRLKRTILKDKVWFYLVDSDEYNNWYRDYVIGVNEQNFDIEKTLIYQRTKKLERICK